jgi:hypothetical protein
MQEAVVALGFLALATIFGMLLKPNEDQQRPLTPQGSSGDAGHHDHHHH